VQDAGETVIGDDNWIMAYVHIAHDCHVGSNTIMSVAIRSWRITRRWPGMFISVTG
jgi:hypothetical protein